MITEPVPVSPQDTPKPRRSRQSARSLMFILSRAGGRAGRITCPATDGTGRLLPGGQGSGSPRRSCSARAARCSRWPRPTGMTGCCRSLRLPVSAAGSGCLPGCWRKPGRCGSPTTRIRTLTGKRSVASWARPEMNRSGYLTGGCGLLALAVHRITGWPLAEMLEPYHVLVRMPDGRLLDAAGSHAPDCLDGFRWREADAEALAVRYGRRAAAPDVAADARELLAAWPPGGGEVTPLPFRPRPRRVSAAGLETCGLVPAEPVSALPDLPAGRPRRANAYRGGAFAFLVADRQTPGSGVATDQAGIGTMLGVISTFGDSPPASPGGARTRPRPGRPSPGRK
jgi:hypothetical protein